MKKYRSEISEYIHKAAKDLQSIDLMDDDSMQELDNLCLVEQTGSLPVKPIAKNIKPSLVIS